MKSHERRGTHGNRERAEAAGTEEERPESAEQPVARHQIGRSPACRVQKIRFRLLATLGYVEKPIRGGCIRIGVQLGGFVFFLLCYTALRWMLPLDLGLLVPDRVHEHGGQLV